MATLTPNIASNVVQVDSDGGIPLLSFSDESLINDHEWSQLLTSFGTPVVADLPNTISPNEGDDTKESNVLLLQDDTVIPPEYKRMALVLGWDKKSMFQTALGLRNDADSHQHSKLGSDKVWSDEIQDKEWINPRQPSLDEPQRSSMAGRRIPVLRTRCNSRWRNSGTGSILREGGVTPATGPRSLGLSSGKRGAYGHTPSYIRSVPKSTKPQIELYDATIFDRITSDEDRRFVVWSNIRGTERQRDGPLNYRITPVRRPSVLGHLRQHTMQILSQPFGGAHEGQDGNYPENNDKVSPGVANRKRMHSQARRHRLTLVSSPPGNPTEEGAKSLIMAATPEKLVQKLTTEVDYTFLSDFFLTYREFLTALDLCRLLFLRFLWATQEQDRAHQQVRVRLFVVLRFWLRNYFTLDFAPSPTLRTLFADQWANIWSTPACQSAVGEVRILVQLERLMHELAHTYGGSDRLVPVAQTTMDLPLSPVSPGVIKESYAIIRQVWGPAFCELAHRHTLQDTSKVKLTCAPESNGPSSGLAPSATTVIATGRTFPSNMTMGSPEYSYFHVISQLQASSKPSLPNRARRESIVDPFLSSFSVRPTPVTEKTPPTRKQSVGRERSNLKINTVPLNQVIVQKMRQASPASRQRLSGCACPQPNGMGPAVHLADGDASQTETNGSKGGKVANTLDGSNGEDTANLGATPGWSMDVEHYHSNPFDVSFFSQHEPAGTRVIDQSFPQRVQRILLGKRSARQRFHRLYRKTNLYYTRRRIQNTYHQNQRSMSLKISSTQAKKPGDSSSPLVRSGSKRRVISTPVPVAGGALLANEVRTNTRLGSAPQTAIIDLRPQGVFPTEQPYKTLTLRKPKRSFVNRYLPFLALSANKLTTDGGNQQRFPSTSLSSSATKNSSERESLSSRPEQSSELTNSHETMGSGRHSLDSTAATCNSTHYRPSQDVTQSPRSLPSSRHPSPRLQPSGGHSNFTMPMATLTQRTNSTSGQTRPQHTRKGSYQRELPSSWINQLGSRSRGKASCIFYFRSEVIAQQLCLLECSVLQRINWQELIELRWQKRKARSKQSTTASAESTKEEDTNCGVSNVIRRFDRMSQWVVTEIVRTADIQERVLVVEKFIRIALKCYYHANFSTLMQIIFALTSSPVTRLKHTWELVNDEAYETFQHLKNFASPTRNWKNLRDATRVMLECGCGQELGEMRICPMCSTASLTIQDNPSTIHEVYQRFQIGGCVPFLGLFLSELVMNAEHPTYIKPRAPSVATTNSGNSSSCSSCRGSDSPKDTETQSSRCSTSKVSSTAADAPLMVNFHKLRTLAVIIKRLVAFQTILTRRYPFTQDSVLYPLLERQLEVWDETQVMNQSCRLE
ncbi:Guanine nucleotide exchange factor lte1 [Dispira simplex]|nr:Guanine nucleotide exchange factor lte1 [Dispira simplex]